MTNNRTLTEISFLFIIICILFGCAKSDFQWYSSENDNMNCYRSRLKASQSLVSLAFEAKRSEIHIPFIFRSVTEKSPYRIKFVSSTSEPKFETVIVRSASLTDSKGKVILLVNPDKPINLQYSFEDYSGYALGSAYEADCLLTESLNIDHKTNDKLKVSVKLSLIKANKIFHETVVADFYPIHERGVGLIFKTYTN